METAEIFQWLFSYVDSFDARPTRPHAAERDRPLDRVAGAFEYRLHAPVWQVSHPADQVLGSSEGFGRSAEIHALDAAGHHHASADSLRDLVAQAQSAEA